MIPALAHGSGVGLGVDLGDDGAVPVEGLVGVLWNSSAAAQMSAAWTRFTVNVPLAYVEEPGTVGAPTSGRRPRRGQWPSPVGAWPSRW